jgi:ABC-type glycerol-3-phosphate transport system substrate-binding protein
MTTMSRRTLITLLAGTGVTGVFVACSSPAAPAAAPTQAAAAPAAAKPTVPPTTAPAAQAAGPTPTARSVNVESQTSGFKLSAPAYDANAKVVLTFLNAGTSQVESAHQNKFVQQWNTENADIQVDLQFVAWADLNTKTQAYLAAGTPPDVSWYCGSADQEAYAKGWIEPLDDYLKDVKDTYNPLLFAPGSPSMTPDGQHWIGVPFCMYGEGLVVRKDYFQSAGVTDLSGLTTWAGFKDAVAKVAKPPTIYGYQFPQDPASLTYTASRFFLSNGLEHLADFRADKKDAYVQVLDFIKQMLQFSPDAAKAWNHGGEIAAWTAGNIASMGTGSYFFGDIIPTAPDIATSDKMAAMPFPIGPQLKKPVNSLGFCGYMMFKDSKHKDETAKFLKFMGSNKADSEFPMNLDPSKTVSLDQRVRAYKQWSPDHYQQDQWWQEAWIKITDPTSVDQKFATGYIPSNEIDHLWANVFPSWAYGSASGADAYEQLKSQITPILKNPPK